MPALQVLLSKWAPPNERNKISSLVYAGQFSVRSALVSLITFGCFFCLFFSGMSLGTVIALPFSGILAEKIGWESVFYVQGGLGSIWCILWILLVFDSPKDHPRIHPAERDLFEKCMENGGAKRPVRSLKFRPLNQFHITKDLHNLSLMFNARTYPCRGRPLRLQFRSGPFQLRTCATISDGTCYSLNCQLT